MYLFETCDFISPKNQRARPQGGRIAGGWLEQAIPH
jgi:hypothetical protein